MPSIFIKFIHCPKRVVIFSPRVGFELLASEAVRRGPDSFCFVMVHWEDDPSGWWWKKMAFF